MKTKARLTSIFPTLRRNTAAIALAVLLLSPAAMPAQDAPHFTAPFLLPHTIFVGDTGRLVVTLGEAFAELPSFVLENPAHFPERPDLVIRRIELDRRGGTSRLLIDFVPFAPGTLFFPSLDFAALGTSPEETAESPLTLSGLNVQVASILNPAWMELSAPAAPMVVPGTGLLIYGSVAVLLLFLSLGIAFSVWCKRNFRGFWQRLHRRHLLRTMLRFLRRLVREANLGKGGKPAHYLGLLSTGFRDFLSAFTGINCRALTPAEFLELPISNIAPDSTPSGEPVLTPAFLCGLFRAWDTLRFSGQEIGKDDLYKAVKETENFVRALYAAEKQRQKEKTHQKQMEIKLAGRAPLGEAL